MSYVRVLDDAIVSSDYPPEVLSPPDPTSDGRDWDLRRHDYDIVIWETDIIGPHGWLPVLYTVRPLDTATDTFTSSIELINGVPTEVWTQRPWTQDELTNKTDVTNTAQLVSESEEAVDKLVLVVENLNLLTSKTNSEINANPAAIIKDLARECKTIARQANREARLTSGKTDSTNTGTESP